MERVKIVTDSNSGILQEEGKEAGIVVVPMPFTVNLEEHFEEITMDKEKFFELLEAGADVSTSQPSEYYLEELWDGLLKDYEEVVFIPMMAGLSKTYENATRYAEKYGGRVHVVDNKRISVTLKESVYEAKYLADMGKSGAEIKEYLERTGSTASIYISLNTLKYLRKGGRITPAAAALGDMLKLKPVLYTRGGSFEKFALAISTGQAKKKMISQIKHELENDFKEDYENGRMVVSVAHTQNYAEAEKFKEEIKKEIPLARFHYVDPLSLSVSCHIGPGALAMAVCVSNYPPETE